MVLPNFTWILLLVSLLPSLINTDNVTSNNNRENITKENLIVGACKDTTSGNRNILYVIILVFVFVIGLLGNVLAVTVILFSRSLRRQSTNLFVASLNICDIGAIICTVPLRINEYLYDDFCYDIHVCRFFNIVELLFHVSSISHLFVMAIERLIAVRIPFLFQRTVNRSVTFKMIALTWIYSILWACASTVKWNTPYSLSAVVVAQGNRKYCLGVNPIFWVTVYVVVYIIPLAIMAVLYYLILDTALKQQKTIASLSPSYLKQNHQSEQRRKQEYSASKTIAIIYGAFTLCWLPLSIIVIINQLCPTCFNSFVSNYSTLSRVTFATFIIVLPAIHSCLNPFIYIIFHQRFRVALKALLRGKLNHFDNNLPRRSKGNISARTTETASL